MDEIDQAQEANEQFQADALRVHWRRQPLGMGLEFCEDCGEAIPEARRRAMPSCTRCVACQGEHEHLQEILSHWR